MKWNKIGSILTKYFNAAPASIRASIRDSCEAATSRVSPRGHWGPLFWLAPQRYTSTGNFGDGKISQFTKLLNAHLFSPPTNTFSPLLTISSGSSPPSSPSSDCESNLNLTRWDWTARKAPKMPAAPADLVQPALAKAAEAPSRLRGMRRSGFGTTTAPAPGGPAARAAAAPPRAP